MRFPTILFILWSKKMTTSIRTEDHFFLLYINALTIDSWHIQHFKERRTTQSTMWEPPAFMATVVINHASSPSSGRVALRWSIRTLSCTDKKRGALVTTAIIHRTHDVRVHFSLDCFHINFWKYSFYPERFHQAKRKRGCSYKTIQLDPNVISLGWSIY